MPQRCRASCHLNVTPDIIAREAFAGCTWQMPHVQAGPCTAASCKRPDSTGPPFLPRTLHTATASAAGCRRHPAHTATNLSPPCSCDTLHPHQLHLRHPQSAAATAPVAACGRQSASAAGCRRQATSTAACGRQPTSAATPACADIRGDCICGDCTLHAAPYTEPRKS